MIEKHIDEAGKKMDKALEATDHEFKSLRTGRATSSMLDGVIIQAYGTDSPINQVASVSTPDAATILVQPWDAGVIASIEKGILAANLGLTPSNDGKVVRLRVPELTEETRKEMVKKAHELAEHGRVAIRSVRRHINDEVKKLGKDHEIAEDDLHRLLDKIQKKTDAHVESINKMLAKKEEEIMQV